MTETFLLLWEDLQLRWRVPSQNTPNRSFSFKKSLITYEDELSICLCPVHAQEPNFKRTILTWFQDLCKSIDGAKNVACGPPSQRRKDMITPYLKGMDCSPGPI